VRVSAAQQANPATKDWVRKAVKREGGRRCPVRLKRLSLDVIVRYGDALADVFCEYPDDLVAVIPYEWTIGYQSPGHKAPVNPVEAMMSGAQWTDEWGVRWAHAVGGVGAAQIGHPLKDWAQLDAYLENQMPDPRGARLDEAARQLAVYRETKYCYGVNVLGLFELLRAIRGMQDLFIDFHTNEDCVRRLMDAIADFLMEVIRGWAEIGADGLFFGDDWGMQSRLMISPAMWRSFFKPYYKRLFDEAHRLGLDILFHSCGHVLEIVGDLVEVGVDILDPIQPGAMDVEELARRYGGQISFSGAIDIQNLMVFGKPEEIRSEVRRLIDTLGTRYGNGFIVGPANVMTPEIPLENIRAMFDVCHNQ
jgi:uroporphyrinogen decarboxylase